MPHEGIINHTFHKTFCIIYPINSCYEKILILWYIFMRCRPLSSKFKQNISLRLLNVCIMWEGGFFSKTFFEVQLYENVFDCGDSKSFCGETRIKDVFFLFLLLQKMLTYNPSKRISAREALNHPYFEDLDKTILPTSNINADWATQTHVTCSSPLWIYHYVNTCVSVVTLLAEFVCHWILFNKTAPSILFCTRDTFRHPSFHRNRSSSVQTKRMNDCLKYN